MGFQTYAAERSRSGTPGPRAPADRRDETSPDYGRSVLCRSICLHLASQVYHPLEVPVDARPGAWQEHRSGRRILRNRHAREKKGG
jgi:hypothetical protein